MKLSYRQKLSIFFAVITIILVAWYFLILNPQQTFITDTKKEIANISKEITLSRSSLGSIDKILIENTQLQTELDSLLLTIPNREQISSITNLIVSIGRKNEMNVVNIQPSLDALLKSADYLIKVPIDITLEGKYINFGNFISDIQKLSSKLYIQDVKLEADQDNNSGSRAQLKIVINSYVYVINDRRAA